MEYTFKAHPTEYADVVFRSRLEARWAAFFDLAGWEWEYEPIDFPGWTPDFRVKFSCGHSECYGYHALLVEVKPYFDFKDFYDHIVSTFDFGFSKSIGKLPADATAGFGINTSDAASIIFSMQHGAGGGYEHISYRVANHEALWKKAGDLTKYEP